MLTAVHMCWAYHPAWPSDHLDANSLENLLTEILPPGGGGTLSRQLLTRPLPATPVPVGYCGRNHRFGLTVESHEQTTVYITSCRTQ